MAARTKMNTGNKIHLFSLCATFVTLVLLCQSVDTAKETKDTNSENEKWKKKDIRDYTDADLERLYDQWEEADEDPLESDELPDWKKEPIKIDINKLNPSNPEDFLKQSKKGQSLMLFATVSGSPTQKEADKITSLWQSSLFNANIEIQRYMVSTDRAIFMLKDGALAWDVKDFLVKQDRCKEVTIEGKSYPGAAAGSTTNQKTEL